MAHGPHWQSLIESTDEVLEYLPELVRTALPVEGQKPDPTAEFLYIRNTDEPLGTLALIRNTGGDSHQFVTTYPICWAGAENELEVQ